jgi:hypothetical protein
MGRMSLTSSLKALVNSSTNLSAVFSPFQAVFSDVCIKAKAAICPNSTVFSRGDALRYENFMGTWC